jgi:N6-adenosine-specific RNA methylase IME4
MIFMTIQLPNARSRAQFVEWITEAWQSSVAAIIETGRRLTAAKDELAHGEWLPMIENDLPFGRRYAQMLMKIAADQRITNANHVSLLPPSVGTLVQINRMDDDTFERCVANGTIRPDVERREIAHHEARARRKRREREWGGKVCALPKKRFGVIYADPEWPYEAYSSETGLDRSPENHYPTSSIEEIMARDVPSIAADDCVCFLWAANLHLADAIDVLRAWGFTYKSSYVWVKNGNDDMGYWCRNRHEYLLIGTRGSPVCPAMGEQWSSVIEAPRGEHSAKPEAVLEMIEQYFPNVPKIELNRRGPPRPGWSAWGFEAE